ncbi:MAG: hypothetical protein V1722_02560 [Candidatus Micrarchaeota archaeon]
MAITLERAKKHFNESKVPRHGFLRTKGDALYLALARETRKKPASLKVLREIGETLAELHRESVQKKKEEAFKLKVKQLVHKSEGQVRKSPTIALETLVKEINALSGKQITPPVNRWKKILRRTAIGAALLGVPIAAVLGAKLLLPEMRSMAKSVNLGAVSRGEATPEKYKILDDSKYIGQIQKNPEKNIEYARYCFAEALKGGSTALSRAHLQRAVQAYVRAMKDGSQLSPGDLGKLKFLAASSSKLRLQDHDNLKEALRTWQPNAAITAPRDMGVYKPPAELAEQDASKMAQAIKNIRPTPDALGQKESYLTIPFFYVFREPGATLEDKLKSLKKKFPNKSISYTTPSRIGTRIVSKAEARAARETSYGHDQAGEVILNYVPIPEKDWNEDILRELGNDHATRALEHFFGENWEFAAHSFIDAINLGRKLAPGEMNIAKAIISQRDRRITDSTRDRLKKVLEKWHPQLEAEQAPNSEETLQSKPLEEEPNPPDWKREQINANLQVGFSKLKSGDLDTAARAFTRAIEWYGERFESLPPGHLQKVREVARRLAGTHYGEELTKALEKVDASRQSEKLGEDENEQ